jgi:hypothetical protein
VITFFLEWREGQVVKSRGSSTLEVEGGRFVQEEWLTSLVRMEEVEHQRRLKCLVFAEKRWCFLTYSRWLLSLIVVSHEFSSEILLR